MPRAEIHANVLETILSGDYLPWNAGDEFEAYRLDRGRQGFKSGGANTKSVAGLVWFWALRRRGRLRPGNCLLETGGLSWRPRPGLRNLRVGSHNGGNFPLPPLARSVEVFANPRLNAGVEAHSDLLHNDDRPLSTRSHRHRGGQGREKFTLPLEPALPGIRFLHIGNLWSGTVCALKRLVRRKGCKSLRTVSRAVVVFVTLALWPVAALG